METIPPADFTVVSAKTLYIYIVQRSSCIAKDGFICTIMALSFTANAKEKKKKTIEIEKKLTMT